MSLSSKLREEYRALWRRNERPIGLFLNQGDIQSIADEYKSKDARFVHWLLYGLTPKADESMPIGKFKFICQSWKPKEKQEHLLASIKDNK